MVSRQSVGVLGTVAVTAMAWLVALGAASGGAAGSAGTGPSGGVTNRVSVGPGGAQPNSLSYGPSISRGGRYVAFASRASNLIAKDTNKRVDVFVRDRVAHVTRRVSVGAGGGQANGSSWDPSISADGRYVAFTSSAPNLVAGDSNGGLDVFVRDRVAHVTRRVSVGPGGGQGNGSGSFQPSISADGRYVAFASGASNLVAGDTNGSYDVFVRDRVAHVTQRVSVGPGGAEADGGVRPAISADGRYVAFESYASNLVAGDTNESSDVFVRDRKTQVTQRASVGPGGAQADGSSSQPSISAGGRYVAFESYAPDLVTGDTNESTDVFVRDRVAQVTQRVSVGAGGTQANKGSVQPSISADGRYVAFISGASNLVAGDTNVIGDVYVRDRVVDATVLVSVGHGGADANANSTWPSIAGGRYVAFESYASNLVARDTNKRMDVFVRDLVG